MFATLCSLYDSDRDTLKEYGEILYNQALLIEGILPEDPAAYADAVCRLMHK